MSEIVVLSVPLKKGKKNSCLSQILFYRQLSADIKMKSSKINSLGAYKTALIFDCFYFSIIGKLPVIQYNTGFFSMAKNQV